MVFNSCIPSGTFGGRVVAHPVVTELELATAALRKVSKQHKMTQRALALPEERPLSLNEVLSLSRPWRSPTVPPLVKSALAWRWMQKHAELPDKPSGEAAWWSWPVPLHHVLKIGGGPRVSFQC